jgi:REP element-mobilizing transposase RayT
MDRFWLLTWTTYGTWLPGDARGFVSNVRDGDGPEVRHNLPGTPYDADMAGLRCAAREALKGPPISLQAEQAIAALEQFRETARYRGWTLLAAAVMANHTHLVVGLEGDPDPAQVLHSFKSYASRALNARWGKPAGAGGRSRGRAGSCRMKTRCGPPSRMYAPNTAPWWFGLTNGACQRPDPGERGVSTP